VNGRAGTTLTGKMAHPASLSVVETMLRLGAAAAFGAVIGFEREVDGHDAGVRTHLLLALGSALFGAISVGAFASFITNRNATNITVDPTRIASYVAAGVGFLGGGAILKRPDRVKGLTTASSLWVVSAVGLAAGLGFWSGAVVGTVITVVVLVAERPTRRLVSSLRRAREHDAVSPNHDRRDARSAG
jgi:putative Mg2+ transporter-C (MgtC) family protein